LVKKCIIFLFLVSILSGHIAHAQDVDKAAEVKPDPRLKDVDKIVYVNMPNDTSIHTPSPTRVLFESMFFPGAGQFDNKKYIKGTIVFSLEIALIGAVKHYSDKTISAKRRFDNAKAVYDGTLSNEVSTVPSSTVSSTSATVSETELYRLFNDYQNARDEQNRFRWYLGAFIFLSMFDAFVDAHLAQFPKVNDRLSFDVGADDKDMLSVKLSYYLW
jgi:hypothetical protein